MANNDGVAAIVIDGEAILKRINYYPGENLLILETGGPDYKDLVYTGEQLGYIVILGKAVALQNNVK